MFKLQSAIEAFVIRHVDSGRSSSLRSGAYPRSRWCFWPVFAGLALTGGMLLYYALHSVHAIEQLGTKADRYRRRELLGARTTRKDEIGALDAALHEFASAQERRELDLERYRMLAEVTQQIILFIDRTDGTILDANAAALSAYGYTRSDLVGQPLAMLKAVGVPPGPEEVSQSDDPGGVTFERIHQRSDGTCFPIEIRARTANAQGRRTIIATCRDISERVRASEQVERALQQAVKRRG